MPTDQERADAADAATDKIVASGYVQRYETPEGTEVERYSIKEQLDLSDRLDAKARASGGFPINRTKFRT